MQHTGRAFLDMPVDRAIGGFEIAARQLGLTPERTPTGLRLALRLGTIDVAPDGDGADVSITAETAAKLQSLRDLLAERVEETGLVLDWRTGAAGRRPGNLSVARIEDVARLSPSYMRVRVSGPDLGRFARGGLHFRLLFGPEGADWPSIDDTGVTQWPGGPAAWHRPVYTTREIVGPDGEPPGPGDGPARITFDVFLHEGGRVTEWVRGARPGDTVALTGPGGSDQPDAGWIGIIGDETAVPVAARILADAPPHTKGRALLFVPDTEDVQDLPRPAGMSLDWIMRGEGSTPVTAFDGLELPATDRFLFFAAERSEAVHVRHLLAERGFRRGEYHAAAYWTAPGTV